MCDILDPRRSLSIRHDLVRADRPRHCPCPLLLCSQGPGARRSPVGPVSPAPQDLVRITVRLKHGDIIVVDARRDAQARKRPLLDLHTSDGRVHPSGTVHPSLIIADHAILIFLMTAFRMSALVRIPMSTCFSSTTVSRLILFSSMIRTASAMLEPGFMVSAGEVMMSPT